MCTSVACFMGVYTVTSQTSIVPDNMQILPNPYNKELKIIGEKNRAYSCRIYDHLGMLLLQHEFTSKANLNLPDLVQGYYLLDLYDVHH